jgi:hypothetical protein
MRAAEASAGAGHNRHASVKSNFAHRGVTSNQFSVALPVVTGRSLRQTKAALLFPTFEGRRSSRQGSRPRREVPVAKFSARKRKSGRRLTADSKRISRLTPARRHPFIRSDPLRAILRSAIKRPDLSQRISPSSAKQTGRACKRGSAEGRSPEPALSVRRSGQSKGRGGGVPHQHFERVPAFGGGGWAAQLC